MSLTNYVAIIDPAARVAETDCFNRIARQSPLPCTYYLPALQGDTLPQLGTNLKAVVILGSGASVHDDLAWQDNLRKWLKPVIEAEVPLLGICYGHQLIAHLMGGDVGFVREDQEKLVGFRKIRFLSENLPWPTIAPTELVVSHREMVTRIPEEFDLIATSEQVNCEALKHKSKPIYLIQAHPEATLTFLENQSIPPPFNPDLIKNGHPIVDEFIKKLAADS